MLNTKFSPWPSFSEEEARAISKVLLSNKVNYWTGQECRAFEREFADFCGTKYAIALANGTVALDLALKAARVGPGDEVIVTPRTFIATASCVVNAGAKPIFADVDPDSGNVSRASIEAVLSPRTRAVIAVHLAGWPCDMDPIMTLAKERGFLVIEDCAQAHGARYKGRSVGSIGHIGAWSFCQDKIITTGGEGGMVTTDNPVFWDCMWSYKDHGKNYNSVYMTDHPPGFRWLHDNFGTNWRMTEIQATIGRLQLRKINEWTSRRNINSKTIADALISFTDSGGPLRIPRFCCDANCKDKCDCTHAYYKFYAYVRQENMAYGWSRDRIVEEINAKGVPCYQGTCSEVYLEKAFDGGLRPVERLPVAKRLGETSLMFLVHPTLTPPEIEATCDAIRDTLSQASNNRM